MEFEPFQSDNDEEDFTSIISRRKKENQEWKKKSKSGPIFRSDKKGDTHSPMSLKHKHVHGVVGPADYMFDQTSPSNTENSPPTSIPGLNPTTQQLVNTPINVNVAASMQQRASSSQWNNTPQHNQHQVSFVTQQPTVPFSTNFTAQQTLQNKVDRPHSAAAILSSNDHMLPSSPIPFKQTFKSSHSHDVAQSPQKATLLSQAVSNNVQLSTTPTLTHQRNQSYSNAMSVQAPKSQLENESKPFTVQFEMSAEISTEDSNMSKRNSLENISSPSLHSMEGRQASSEIWMSASSVQNAASTAVETEWANFPIPASPKNEINDNESTSSSASRKISHGTESIQGSLSSLNSEFDDTVWQINEEQREYYTNQFMNLHPENGFVKGPQAREFFLKSNLPTEILSKIWHLSDLDKDYALNLEEFCIAMHLVVAVRHGMELPSFLPLPLFPASIDEVNPFEADLGSPDDESFDDSEYTMKQKWESEFNGLDESLEKSEVLITSVQPLHTLSNVNTEMTSASSLENIDSLEVLNNVTSSPKVRNGSTPLFKDSNAAIARPRASGSKNVNLMDASPWQLLPPPSSKVGIKKSLNLGSNDDLSNIQENTSLVSIDRSGEVMDGNSPTPDFENNNQHLRSTTKNSTSLLKEKSRSIDSLRSDISENNDFQFKKQAVPVEKKRSLTFDKVPCSSETSLHEKIKDIELPPVPPPRNRGHVRASSLDLNHLFNSKTCHSVPDMLKELTEEDNSNTRIKPVKPPRISKPINVSSEQVFSTSPTTSVNESRIHQRTFSLDSEVTLSSASRLSEGLLTLESMKKKTYSAEEKIPKHKSKVQFSEDVYNEISYNPMEVQMRRNELQARLRLLQSKNLTLLSLNNDLNLEWKELCEKRISYEVQLQKLMQKTHIN